MNGGLAALIAGVLAVLLAWLGGRRSKAKEQKMMVEQVKRQTAQKVSTIQSDITSKVVDNARSQGESAAEHDEVIRQIDKARKANDMDAISRIAQSLAERALNRGASQK